MNLAENMREYLKNTPRDQVLKAWAKSEKFDSVCPTVDQFLIHSKRVGRRFRLGKQIGRRYMKRYSVHDWLVEFFEQEEARAKEIRKKYDYKIFLSPADADVWETKYKESMKKNQTAPGGSGE